MADFISISYLTIIIAAIVPALVLCLSFHNVIFESRSLGVEVAGDTDLDPITLQDWVNLILVVANFDCCDCIGFGLFACWLRNDCSFLSLGP